VLDEKLDSLLLDEQGEFVEGNLKNAEKKKPPKSATMLFMLLMHDEYCCFG
jgi:hypothetical protein